MDHCKIDLAYHQMVVQCQFAFGCDVHSGGQQTCPALSELMETKSSS